MNCAKGWRNWARKYLTVIVSELNEMFEKSIKIISRTLAAVLMFVLADSFYLSQKGFVWDNGNIVLVKNAQAAESNDAAAKPLDTANFRIYPHHFLGNEEAPVTIYEFSSLGCTHCADFHLGMLPKLREDFIDSGKVKLVFADFPIDKRSMQAAMLARCMPEEKYFDFLATVFKKQLSWGLSFKAEKLLSEYAKVEGLSAEDIKKCLNDKVTASDIVDIRRLAMEKLGIVATPSFLIRSGQRDEVISGIPDYDKLKEKLNDMLSD